jgi:hypothetical protein
MKVLLPNWTKVRNRETFFMQVIRMEIFLPSIGIHGYGKKKKKTTFR